MADKEKNRIKAEQQHIALIWKYQLRSQKKNVKQYKQGRTQTRNW